MDFEKVVPPFWGFSTKTDLVVHGFTVHGFLFPPKSAKSEDLLYVLMNFGRFFDEL